MKINKKIIAVIALVIIFVVSGIVTLAIVREKPDNDTSVAVTDETSTQEVVSEEDTTEEEEEEEETSAEETTLAPEYREINEVAYATTNVNIRKAPDTSAAVIDTLQKGESITRTAIGDNGWSKVTYKGATAYVYSKYLTAIDPDGYSKVDMCGISNTDMKNLTDTLEYIFFYNLRADSYNSNSKDAFKKAIRIIHGATFFSFAEVVSEVYRINYDYMEYYYYHDDYFQPDPKGCWKQYKRIDGEFIDLILEEIFNVKPDHGYVVYDKEWSENEDGVYAYYYDGAYYSDASDNGDGCEPDVTIKNVKVLPDEKYQITVNYKDVVHVENGIFETVEDHGDYVIITEMKNIDGTTVWSYYEIQPV